jgi:hypothetical protein
MSTFTLSLNDQQMLFEPRADGRFGFVLQLRSNDAWRNVSAADNPLVRGKSFDLYPDQLERVSESELLASGKAHGLAQDGSRLEYDYTARIVADVLTDWFEVSVILELSMNLELQMIGGFEPEITIDLGALPPYDRGDHVWFKTVIANPTKWNDEAHGNDFPALFYADPYKKLELMMFFDLTAMNWMSRENIARFLNYRCGFRRRYKPGAMAELGLYADGYSGTVFPSGSQQFRYHLRFGEQLEPATETQALTELIQACLKLIPAQSTWAQGATSWRGFASACARDLMDAQCWGSNESLGEFPLNYVNGYSPAWQEALEARGMPVSFELGACLESAVWTGAPLSVLVQLTNDPEQAALLKRFLEFTRRYVLQAKDFGQGKAAGTWQFYFILEQLWCLGRRNNDAAMLEFTNRIIHDLAIPLARNLEYLFPLSYDSATLRRSGNGDNYPVAGLYAQFMLNLYRVNNDSIYLEEAKRALHVLEHLPVNSLSQEVFLLAVGAQAAANLYRLTSNPQDLELLRYLKAQTLRMMYWFTDRSKAEYLEYKTLGMFQACTPIFYPAFFENIEVLTRLASTFDLDVPSLGLLRAFNHARKNNFFLFPECLPPNRHASNLKFIPFENLGLLEDEKTGWIGQEIYGAGQVFGASLLFDALAFAHDRDVMVLNLDQHHALEPFELNTRDLEFIVFNPESRSIQTLLEFPCLRQGDQVLLGLDRNLLKPVELSHNQLWLELEPNAVHWVFLKRGA